MTNFLDIHARFPKKPQSRGRSHSSWFGGVAEPRSTPDDFPDVPTEFELTCARLNLLSNQDMLHSPALRRWVKDNCTERYIPEWLLKEWGFTDHMFLYGFDA